MPITYNWARQDLVMLIHYQGDILRAELEDIFNIMIALLDNADHTLHFIHDVRSVGAASGFNPNGFTNFVKLMRHPRLGYTAIVGANTVVSFWLKVFLKLFKLRYVLFNTPEDALTFMNETIRIYRLDQDSSQAV